MANPDTILSRLLLLLLACVLVLLAFPIHILKRAARNNPEKVIAEERAITLKAKATGHAAASYQLGLGYVTANRSLGVEKGWSLVAQAAHIAYIQRKWPEWGNNAMRRDIDAARKAGLKLYLALEPLADDRKSLKLPDGLRGDFADEAVRKRYLEDAVGLVAEVKPRYFIANVELNLYRKHNRRGYDAFRDFYPELYRSIKEVSSETLVAVSLAYNDWNGRNGIDEEDKEEFRRRVGDFDAHSDMLAVSTYPLSYLTPSAIPESFFRELAAFSMHPLFIAETGWVSESFTITIQGFSRRFASSPEAQSEFLRRLGTCADYAMDEGMPLLAVNYVSLIDIGWFGRQAIRAMLPQFEWFCHLGLLEPSGKPKPAYERMVQWRTRLDGSQ